MRKNILVCIVILFCSCGTFAQNSERIVFNQADSLNDYYLAVRPSFGKINGVILVMTSFMPPERIMPETKLHNVAAVNGLLTVYLSLGQSIYADDLVTARISRVLNHIQTNFGADKPKYAICGFEFAGNIALRYTEYSVEDPVKYPVKPGAVFAIDTPVDLFVLWNRCEEQLKKNFYPGEVEDAKFILNKFTKEIGPINTNTDRYRALTPFRVDEDKPGNEIQLRNIPVRLYYEGDINWYLNNRRNSYFDTYLPAGSEMIKRLLISGNKEAEFVLGKQGVRTTGVRNPNSFSVVDETECIHWIKKALGIFDPVTWMPPYDFSMPAGWTIERFPIPIQFAPQIPYKGVEDVRFAPGWGNSASEEYWSYVFLWWVEGKQQLDTALIRKYLFSYYNGLIEDNIRRRSIPASKVVTTTVQVKAMEKTSKEETCFSGSVKMLDYMQQIPITLNFKAKAMYCETAGHTAIFFEISPKPTTHQVWKNLDKAGYRFECMK
ncbi:MAG: hypothetical protein NTW29_19450 [Bacteroidetes bacterium]|nr:hypothetical protein [Bacteroidota bacterium]